MTETVVSTVSKMTDTVATATESITEIQDYIQSFNKEIGETGAQPTVATISSNSEGEQVIADTIYIDGKEIAAGNIVLTDQVAGDGGEQGGNFQTFMVMNDQQYMLIMANDTDQPAADGEQQTLVAVAAQEEEEEEQEPAPPAPDATPIRDGNQLAANVETPTRRTRFHSKRIKEEVEDSRNDISVYDFNDQPARNQHGSGTGSSSSGTPAKKRALAAAAAAAASISSDVDADGAAAASESANTADDTDDFKTPPKHRGRPSKNSESSRKIKSGSGTLALNTSSGSSNSNVHVCTYCAYTSTKRYLLSRHLKSHSEDRPHKCGICERGFKTLASLQNHVNTHTGVRPHQCKFCEAAFTTSGELVRHIRYRHTHEKPHRCTECDYASVELSKLKRHMRCHTGERPYQCPHCTYASPDTYKLKRHLRIHTGEKPYLCDVCHQRFTQSNSLKAHKLIHTGNKPIFKCDFCPTTCGRKTDLRIHVQKLHTSDKMLTCKRCDQSFPDRYQFKLHLKTHEGEKCFKCDLCNYASVSARHLESHMLIHTDQKPFICDFCNLSFRQKQLLKRHKNLYHNPTYVPPVPKEKTHECAQCQKIFRHKGNLIRHMGTHDPDSKNNLSKDPDTFGNSQLIDDEYYEGEEDYDTNDEPTSVSIVADSSALLDSSSNADGTIAITLDQHTQQLINSNEQLMLVVMPETNEATVTAANGESTIMTVTTTAPTTSTPRIISRSARVTRSAAKASNNDLQVIFDSVAETKPIVANNDESQPQLAQQQQAPQLSFDANEINMEEQLQKRKDLDECFGFKDEDDEDEIILSMPAVHGQ